MPKYVSVGYCTSRRRCSRRDQGEQYVRGSNESDRYTEFDHRKEPLPSRDTLSASGMGAADPRTTPLPKSSSLLYSPSAHSRTNIVCCILNVIFPRVKWTLSRRCSGFDDTSLPTGFSRLRRESNLIGSIFPRSSSMSAHEEELGPIAESPEAKEGSGEYER
jgi:hypothetical protein